MKSAIISVGTELLFGETENSNTLYLTRHMNFLGIDVLFHHTVGDNPFRLKRLIDTVLKEVDIIVATGGLGPTQDDLTKEIVTEALGDKLALHQPSLDALTSSYKESGYKMTENNLKQAYMPQDATVFPNKLGTAPGFALHKEGKIIICLPGPPREMKAMFTEYVTEYLGKFKEDVLFHRMVRTFGIGESQLETLLLPLINGQIDPTIATYAKDGETAVRVASKRKSYDEAREAVDQVIKKMKENIGQYIYSIDDEDLVQVVGKLLIERKISLSSAESCTGGLFAGKITEIPGISKIFDRGIITYSNRAKIEELGVRKETLEEYGAVSPETAKEMALGLKKLTDSDLCISVTGIAGPDGGTEDKPVGLVYIAIWYKDKLNEYFFKNRSTNRERIRKYTVLSMLNYIRNLVLDI